MAKGHSYIINLETFAPFIFTFNPENVSTSKKINYVKQKSNAETSQKNQFEGFDPQEVSFSIVCIDMEDPLGVTEEVAFFETLRDPGYSWKNVSTLFRGNASAPPSQVLFQFGVSLVPLVWNVMDVGIKVSHFHDGHIRGVVGIPKRADISLRLSLDESDSISNKANRIATMVASLGASAESIVKEVLHKSKGGRREKPGLFPQNLGGDF